MHDAELHRFKSDIALPRYAVERYGYQRNPKKSTRSSHALRHPITGDKIVVRLNPDGHWTYFSLCDDRDHGSIVDFVQRRGVHHSLGKIRQELRAWLGTPRPVDPLWDVCTRPAPALDLARVAEVYAAARAVATCPYLETRGLSPKTLSDPRFADTWRLGPFGNVLFAHRDENGVLTGFEIKNRGFTGFATGGSKSAWQSATHGDDRELVVTEATIDALSYHQLRPQGAARRRYLSTGGNPSPRQWATLDRLFAALSPGAVVVTAVDHDDAGEKLAGALARSIKDHAHLTSRRETPIIGKDWNDVLRRSLHADPKPATSLARDRHARP
jgi:hypothetical protein